MQACQRLKIFTFTRRVTANLILEAKQAGILSCLITMYNHHRSESVAPTPLGSYYDIATRYIQMNYHTRLRVRELTDLLGISQPYLHRLFTEACGLSPKAYINACRLDAAKKLLSDTDLSIREIAAAVGYDDTQSFFRFFSKHCAQTPGEFRDSHKKRSVTASDL